VTAPRDPFAGHRRAPWEAEEHELSEGFVSIVYDVDGQSIADHLDAPTARLIAAAPTLLRERDEARAELATLRDECAMQRERIDELVLADEQTGASLASACREGERLRARVAQLEAALEGAQTLLDDAQRWQHHRTGCAVSNSSPCTCDLFRHQSASRDYARAALATAAEPSR